MLWCVSLMEKYLPRFKQNTLLFGAMKQLSGIKPFIAFDPDRRAAKRRAVAAAREVLVEQVAE